MDHYQLYPNFAGGFIPTLILMAIGFIFKSTGRRRLRFGYRILIGRLTSIVWTGTQFVIVGASGTTLTSPQLAVTNSITQVTAQNTFSLRFSPSSLFATLPATLFGQKTRAALYGLTGHKVLKVAETEANREIEVPISGRPKGQYFLEISNPSLRITKPFTLVD